MSRLEDIENKVDEIKKIIGPKTESSVDHPPHYNKHPSGVECIDVVEHMSFNLGNVIKYLWRADHKNGIEDLEKAAWYLNREVERRKKAVATAGDSLIRLKKNYL